MSYMKLTLDDETLNKLKEIVTDIQNEVRLFNPNNYITETKSKFLFFNRTKTSVDIRQADLDLKYHYVYKIDGTLKLFMMFDEADVFDIYKIFANGYSNEVYLELEMITKYATTIKYIEAWSKDGTK